MITFTYTIRDSLGLHARPAGLIVKKSSEFTENSITIQKEGKEVDAKRLFAVMSLGAKQGEQIHVQVEGPSEEETAESLRGFLETIL